MNWNWKRVRTIHLTFPYCYFLNRVPVYNAPHEARHVKATASPFPTFTLYGSLWPAARQKLSNCAQSTLFWFAERSSIISFEDWLISTPGRPCPSIMLIEEICEALWRSGIAIATGFVGGWSFIFAKRTSELVPRIAFFGASRSVPCIATTFLHRWCSKGCEAAASVQQQQHTRRQCN